MKARIWTVVIVLLIGFNCVTLFLVWHKNHNDRLPPNERPADPREFLVSALSLTGDQLQQFDLLRRDHHRRTDSLNNAVRVLKDSLFNQLKKPGVEGADVKAITQNIGQDMAMIDEITFDHFKQVRALLNPGQQKKFDAIIRQVLHMMAPSMPGPGHHPPKDGPPPGDGPNGGGPMPPPPGN